jgi:hypothetical protein
MEIVNYLIFFSLSVYLCWLIGGFLIGLFGVIQKSDPRVDFFRLSAGILLFIFLTAILHTSGGTVAWILLFLPAALAFDLRKKMGWKLPSMQTLILPPGILLVAYIPFFVQYFFYGPFDTIIPADIVDYATFSHFNVKNGVENTFSILNDAKGFKSPAMTPYHYAELWFNEGFLALSPGFNSARALLHITYPIFMATFMLGVYAVVPLAHRNRFFALILLLSALFFGPIAGKQLNHLLDNWFAFNQGIIVFENNGFFGNTLPVAYHGGKHALFMCFVLLLYHVRNRPVVFWAGISVLPVLNIGLILGVVSFCFFEVLLHHRQWITSKKGWLKLILLAMPTLGMACIYLVFAKSSYLTSSAYIYSGSEELNLAGELSRAAQRLGLTLVYLLFIYLPVFPMVWIILKKISYKENILLRILMFILIIPLFSRILLTGFDSAQFLTYLLPAVNAIIMILALEVISKPFVNKRISVAVLGLILCVVGYNIYQTYTVAKNRKEYYTDYYSPEYLNKVEQICKTYPELNIGYVLSDSTRRANMPSNWENLRPGSLAGKMNRWGLISLNFPFDGRSFKSWNNDATANHQQFFFRAGGNQAEFNTQHLGRFIQQQSIKLVFVEKNAPSLPASVPILEVHKDPKSEETIMVLK